MKPCFLLAVIAVSFGNIAGCKDSPANENDAAVTDGSTSDTAVGDGATDDSSVVTAVQPSAAGDIVITEIMAKVAGYADDSLAEWIEVHNPSTTVTYNLQGCTFGDKAGDEDFGFGDLLIGPGEYRVFGSATATVATHGFVTDAVYGAEGTGLSGAGDSPNIKCGAVVIDSVAYSAALGYPLPDNNPGYAIQLDTAHLSGGANDVGANWCLAEALLFTVPVQTGSGANYGTPRAANHACAAAPPPPAPAAAGDIVITEIMAKVAGYMSDDEAEWIEIRNPSATVTYNLEGCTFGDKAGDADFTFPSLLIGPGEYRVFGNAAATVATHGFVTDAVYGASGTGLSGAGDAPQITCGGTVIDSVAYSGALGFPVPDANAGYAIQLDPTAADNDLGANWCLADALLFTVPVEAGSGANYGTPRAVNRSCAAVPPPGAPAAAGDIVITEFMAKLAGYLNDDLGEWVEIYNPSTTVTYDLAGCTFGDKTGDMDYTFTSLLIGPGEYRVFSSAAATVLTHGFVSDAVYGTSSGLSGAGDGPNIKCGATVIDSVVYSAALGFPVPDSNPGYALQLGPTHLSATDNDVGANWCLATSLLFTVPVEAGSGANYGTPRLPNGSCP